MSAHVERNDKAPHVRSRILSQIQDFLFGPLRRHQEKTLKAIIVSNARALSSSQDGFMFRGTWYSIKPGPQPRRKDRLVPELHERMEAYLGEVDEYLLHESPHVRGFITQALNTSYRREDLLAVFPEVLHPAIEDIPLSAMDGPGKLTNDQIEEIKARNQKPIEMIKTRAVLNLLL